MPKTSFLAKSSSHRASRKSPKRKRKRDKPPSAKESWREKMFLESPTKRNEELKPVIIIGVIRKL